MVKKSDEPKCELEMCEDPVTGEIIVKYGEHCPPGYVERLAGKVAIKGVQFVKVKDAKPSKDD